MKLAAIDIGSNAARLLIAESEHSDAGAVSFNKVILVRVPLRLGFDVFREGGLSTEKATAFLKTVMAYKLLLEVYGVKHLKACATSAMRDARNGTALLEQARAETGIDIQLISGQEEAGYIYENHIAEQLEKNKAYLYIDVGGGSTELTLFSKEKMSARASFNIGTIRLLEKQVPDDEWEKMKTFVKQSVPAKEKVIAIGSGGNINKVFSLSGRKPGKSLSLELLKDYYKELGSVSAEERMHYYALRPDRADVIVPALQIYVSVMKWADADEIYVPRIGLVDGLIQALYREVGGEAPAEQ
ncbi:exopolyphosphatase [Compostibacter hankyongensis]|uniref:Rod shape-determining protein n=1 Tax=Compostibacter hankyongensis TaxID=1007089 RepID=A0ABP8FL83_9BACT